MGSRGVRELFLPRVLAVLERQSKIPAPVRFRSAHFLPAQNALVKKPALVGPFAYLSTAAWSNFPLLYRVHRLLPFTVGTSHSLCVSWYKNCRINFHNFRGTTARGPKPFPLQCRRPPTNEGPGAGRVARSPDLTPAESPETSGKHGSQKRAAQRALLRPLQPQRYFQLPPSRVEQTIDTRNGSNSSRQQEPHRTRVSSEDGCSMTSAMATSGREKFKASLKDFVLRTSEPRRRTRFSPQKVGPSRLSGAMILTRLSRLRTCRPCWSQAARHRSLPLVLGVAPNRRELLGDMSLPLPLPPIPRPHLCPISPSSTVLPPLPVTS